MWRGPALWAALFLARNHAQCGWEGRTPSCCHSIFAFICAPYACANLGICMGFFQRKPKLRRKPVTVTPPELNLSAWRYMRALRDAAQQKMVARSLYGLMVIGAAAFGAFMGMMLVYSTDLPQINELDKYRPSAVTELYDVHGRVIASFALQRRIIANYEDFPQVLREAVLSIEDRDFETHWGVDIKRVAGALYRD